MEFTNLDTMFKHIENEIQDTMKNEVANVASTAMKNSINHCVYGVYSPIYYKRRKSNNGLISPNNIDVQEIPNGISIRDIAPLDNGRNDFQLDEIIVNGLGNQPFERDFYTDTVNSLKSDLKHEKALKQGLKKRGINTD